MLSLESCEAATSHYFNARYICLLFSVSEAPAVKGKPLFSVK